MDTDEAVPRQRRTPTGNAARAVQSGQPIQEWGSRQPRAQQPRRRWRFARWLAVVGLVAVTAVMGVRAWERAPVPDTTGCPATATNEECPR